MLEEREHGDHIKALVCADIGGKPPADVAHTITSGDGTERGVDADPARDALSELSEERAVRAAHIEHARAARDMWCGLRDAPARQDAIECLHERVSGA